jgi:hypothetical protein
LDKYGRLTPFCGEKKKRGKTMQNNETNKSVPTLALDVALYDHYLENSNLSEEERHQFIHAMWNLVCEFVFLGFGITSVDHVLDADNLLVEESSATLDSTSKTQVIRAFVDAAIDMREEGANA